MGELTHGAAGHPAGGDAARRAQAPPLPGRDDPGLGRDAGPNGLRRVETAIPSADPDLCGRRRRSILARFRGSDGVLEGDLGRSSPHPYHSVGRSVGRIPAPASAAMSRFACPVCRTVYGVELNRIGRQTTCKQCDAISAISAQPSREVNSEETELSAGDLKVSVEPMTRFRSCHFRSTVLPSPPAARRGTPVQWRGRALRRDEVRPTAGQLGRRAGAQATRTLRPRKPYSSQPSSSWSRRAACTAERSNTGALHGRGLGRKTLTRSRSPTGNVRLSRNDLSRRILAASCRVRSSSRFRNDAICSTAHDTRSSPPVGSWNAPRSRAACQTVCGSRA